MRFRSSVARRQPELFVAAQIHTIDFPVHDRPGLVPADVAASQDSLAGCPVTGEDPLVHLAADGLGRGPLSSRSFGLSRHQGSSHQGTDDPKGVGKRVVRQMTVSKESQRGWHHGP